MSYIVNIVICASSSLSKLLETVAKASAVSFSGTNVALEAGSESVFTYGIKGGIEYEIADNTSLYS